MRRAACNVQRATGNAPPRPAPRAPCLLRLLTALTATFLLGGATSAQGQPFGQNNVQYRRFDYAVLATEHFDVYFYERERAAAVDGARMAERAYGRLSRLLGHEYRERQPIVFYASHADFQQNHISSIGEGTGGITEPFRHRILLPFTGSYGEFERVLLHELAHQFQFDVFARGRAGGAVPRLMEERPPRWFLEGMAEYLALGPVNPQTAMWLRDAALEGGLPDLAQLTGDRRYSPYRFGHALWAYIAERWGEAAVGALLRATARDGLGHGFRTVLGMPVADLIDEWHGAIRQAYLPRVADREHARDVGRAVLTRRRSTGRLHLAPALSPDGATIAYLSEGSSPFIDLYLADVKHGRIERRLIGSTRRSDFESLRYLSSAGAWSPDGRSLAIAAKHAGADDLVIVDVRHGRERRRIRLPLDGVTMPTWSPDGARIAFSGTRGGYSDLYTIAADGSDLRQLTDDPFADLHPAWSPDGTTLAFATDRGPGCDLARLVTAPLAVALYDLEGGTIEILPSVAGTSVNPQWAPDGRSLAFVSDRTGTPNIFLFDLDARATYQLTDVYTGVAGVTPTSPAISWARDADRLAFTYFEERDYDVYIIEEPRAKAGNNDRRFQIGDLRFQNDAHCHQSPIVHRRSEIADQPLPDPSTFGVRDYSPSLSPDDRVDPRVGFDRDAFGLSLFGGTAISMSDVLGTHRIVLAGEVNGRVEETRAELLYQNRSGRATWTMGLAHTPRWVYTGSSVGASGSLPEVTTRLERFQLREAFAEVRYPFDRFRRVELSVRGVSVGRTARDFVEVVDGAGVASADRRDTRLETVAYVQPGIAVVFDNTLWRSVGPVLGQRYRVAYAPAAGEWRFHQVSADYRRYDPLIGPFTLATRIVLLGRLGRDADAFPVYLGQPERVRGYTAASVRANECRADATAGRARCVTLEQLIGSRLGAFSAELRFPLFRTLTLGFLPVTAPPLEAALFFDAGIAWDAASRLELAREDGDPERVRAPVYSVGVSVRSNAFGVVTLRADYALPLSRDEQGAYWTLSLGPTF